MSGDFQTTLTILLFGQDQILINLFKVSKATVSSDTSVE